MQPMDHQQPTSPQVPQYRITLFYGPDPQDGEPASQNCTFNVKKRSWKSGVQVTVNLFDRQLARLRSLMGFDSWLTQMLQIIPKEDVADIEGRAHDVFIQIISSYKLDIAIEHGITQHNQSVAGDTWEAELDSLVTSDISRIKSLMRTELDIPV